MALQIAMRINADSCQIFVKNNMQWSARACDSAHVQDFLALAKTAGVLTFGHTGYLINIASPPGPNRDNSLKSLLQELQLAACLRLPFVVLHPGAHLRQGEEAGIHAAAKALDEIFAATKKLRVKIALENTAGQGSCLGQKLEHLHEIIARCRHRSRLAVCLDTAHLFAAGYDIRSTKGWQNVMRQVERLFGLHRLAAIHLNDSKTDLGSRVDRHAHIGQGKIGLEGFRGIVNDKRLSNVPGCIETPKSDDLHEDVENLTLLRHLCKGK